MVHLNKGEGKMVFQHRGYGFYVCVGLVLSEVLEEDLSFDGIFLEDHFIQDEVLCFVVQFINPINKLQPAGSNRVSPACSVLACSVQCHTMYV